MKNNYKKKPDTVDLFIGHKIKYLRQQKFMTQQNLAFEVGVSYQQIQKYENGSNKISAGQLFYITKALKTPISKIYDGCCENYTGDYDFSNSYEPLRDFFRAKGIKTEDDLRNDEAAIKREISAITRHYRRIKQPRVRKKILQFIKILSEESSNGF